MKPPRDAGPRPGEQTLCEPAAAALSSPPWPAVAWRETGRAGRGDALWITWIAVVEGCGDTFYRSMVVADGGIEVSVEREPRSGGGAPRALHRGRCGLPPDDSGDGVEERAAALLAAADDAVARAADAGGRARTNKGAEPDKG